MKRVVSVRDAMTPNVLTAIRSTNVAKAAKLMAALDVGSIVIIEDKKPVGILTERDLLMKVVSEDLKPSTIRVGKIMSAPIIVISPEKDIVEAARIMAKNKIRRIPVVENKKLIGIITSTDISLISPELAEIMVRSEHASAEQIGQASAGRIDESVCEICGEVTTDLYEVNGTWVCENCRGAMSE